MQELVALPRTLALIVNCYESAEREVRRLIAEKYAVHDEVFINRLFYGELLASLKRVNEEGLISRTLADDLNVSFGQAVSATEVSRLSRGIVARVSYHEPQTEKVTGGDLGLTFSRPNFKLMTTTTATLSHSLHEQGLLCQAKRQQINSTWGRLTPSQRKVLPQRLDYLAFLFYGYEDPQRRQLREFRWKPCAGQDLIAIAEWLSGKEMCDTLGSADLLRQLAMGMLGTSDQKIVNETICSPERTSIKIEITWQNGYPKPPVGTGPSNGLDWLKSFGEVKGGQHQRNTHLPSYRSGYIKGGS